jgi:hypothetical protein
MELNILSEDEPTVLEYARFHGLSTNYALEKPTLRIIPPITDEAFDQDSVDPPDAPAVTNCATELTKERLAVSKEAALLLRSVHLLSEPLDTLQLISDRRRHILGSKHEVGLLRTDHELDVLHFGSTATPTFADLRVPLEPVDEENDEGFEWPSKYATYPAQCFERAKSEKLEVSRDILFYLQETAREHLEPPDVEKIMAEGLIHRRVSDTPTKTRWLTHVEHSPAAPDTAATSFVATNDTLHPIVSYKPDSTPVARFKLHGCRSSSARKEYHGGRCTPPA